MRSLPLVVTVALALSACGRFAPEKSTAVNNNDQAAADSFDPRSVQVVMAGILQWQDPGIGTFAQSLRQDRALEDLLLTRGVPRDNLTFLQDDAATKRAILDTLAAKAAATPPGGTLVYYFAGHGHSGADDAYQIPWDYSKAQDPDSALSTHELESAIADHFQGGTVLLLGDYCYSGGIGELALRLGERAGIRAAAISSAHRNAASTGQWTYTDAVTGIFAGDPLADFDGDGVVTFSEADRHVAREMRYRDAQRSGSAHSAAFPVNYAFSAPAAVRYVVPALGGFRAGDYVETRYEGKWLLSRIDGANDKQLHVSFLVGTDPRTAWVVPGDVRAPQHELLAVGTKVDIPYDDTDKTKVYVGQIIAQDGEFSLVRYDDYPPSDDEWLPPERLVAHVEKSSEPASPAE